MTTGTTASPSISNFHRAAISTATPTCPAAPSYRDEDAVDDDDPENVGEEGRLYGLPHGSASAPPLLASNENAKIALIRARTKGRNVDPGAGFARTEGIHLLASYREGMSCQ